MQMNELEKLVAAAKEAAAVVAEVKTIVDELKKNVVTPEHVQEFETLVGELKALLGVLKPPVA
jgi:hypothetical protein